MGCPCDNTGRWISYREKGGNGMFYGKPGRKCFAAILLAQIELPEKKKKTPPEETNAG